MFLLVQPKSTMFTCRRCYCWTPQCCLTHVSKMNCSNQHTIQTGKVGATKSRMGLVHLYETHMEKAVSVFDDQGWEHVETEGTQNKNIQPDRAVICWFSFRCKVIFKFKRATCQNLSYEQNVTDLMLWRLCIMLQMHTLKFTCLTASPWTILAKVLVM